MIFLQFIESMVFVRFGPNTVILLTGKFNFTFLLPNWSSFDFYTVYMKELNLKIIISFNYSLFTDWIHFWYNCTLRTCNTTNIDDADHPFIYSSTDKQFRFVFQVLSGFVGGEKHATFIIFSPVLSLFIYFIVFYQILYDFEIHVAILSMFI